MTILRSKRLAIIGAGNIGRIVLERLILSGVPADHLLINDSDESHAQQASRRFGARVCTLTDDALSDVDVFLLSSPPKSIIGVLRELTPHLHEGQVIVSFAAGIPLHRLEAMIPSGVSVVRVMPNAPSLVGQGMNPVSYGASVSAQARTLVQSILRTLGQCIVVDDAQMNLCVGLTGAAMRSLLPALEGLMQAGVEAGFSEKEARQMAARVMLGTGAMAATRDLSFDELKSLTPMDTLDEAAVRGIFLQAVRTAKEKIDRLQQKLEQSEEN
jgi:pyrroline-5-carboxylate reductase